MDIELIKLSLLIFNMLVTAAVWLYVHHDRGSHELNDSIKTLERHVSEEFAQKCLRIARLEAQVKSSPTKDDIIRTHERLDESLNDSRTMMLMLGEISGQIKQMNNQRRHNDNE